MALSYIAHVPSPHRAHYTAHSTEYTASSRQPGAREGVAMIFAEMSCASASIRPMYSSPFSVLPLHSAPRSVPSSPGSWLCRSDANWNRQDVSSSPFFAFLSCVCASLVCQRQLSSMPTSLQVPQLSKLCSTKSTQPISRPLTRTATAPPHQHRQQYGPALHSKRRAHLHIFLRGKH